MARWKNRLLARLLARFPFLARRVFESWRGQVVENREVPWTPLSKPLSACRVALITTAGVHRRDQEPFDMQDPQGDPSFRVIPASSPAAELMITHDYYDHRPADRDLNVVFPWQRLAELAREGVIGEAAPRHYGFMGHLLGRHLDTLVRVTAPEVARRLGEDGVDVVLLTPG